ncbi:MAG: lipid A deacylase LpxR family protein [Herminiimonas sp.]|nr:lipid A deacylase LpxR family protein [Herminiimonas sp.]
MRPQRGTLFALLVLAASTAACAATPADFWNDFQRARSQEQVTTTLRIDNDSLLLNRNDGFYTSGAQLTRAFRLDAGAAGPMQPVVIYGWRVGQELYTPADIKLAPQDIPPSDHPYAGWLYAGVMQESVLADGSHARIGVDLGCLGPCALGRETQQTLHRILRQKLPQGWSQQVRNEPGVVVHADLAAAPWQFGRNIDLAPGLQGRLGNIHTDVAGSLLLRAGLLDADAAVPAWQGSMRLQARAVGYDATLQGGYFSTGNPRVVTPKRLVGEAELGLSWRYRRYQLSAAMVRRTSEIVALSNARGAQNFVRLELAVTP